MVPLLRCPAPAVSSIDVPPPPAVMLYLDDFCGGRCRCLVRTGDHVALGEPIGLPDGNGAAVHASVSGIVRAAGGGAVVIENDFRDTPAPGAEPLPTLYEVPAETLRQRLNASGILTWENRPLLLPAGRPCHVLALNLLSPDPSEQDAPPLETPERVFGGLRALIRIAQPRRTLVIWDRRHSETGVLLQRYGVPAESFPADGRKPFPLSRLTGHAPEPGIALDDLGCLVLDAQGAAAVWEALYWGRPNLRRRILITGPRSHDAVSLTAPLGTAVCHLLSAARISAPTILLGSAKTGRILRELQTPIGKTDGRITCLSGR